MYNLSVAREVLKQVYVAERLAPPSSFAEVKTAYSTIFQQAIDVGKLRELLRSGTWAKVGIYGLEAYGIFKVCVLLGVAGVVYLFER